jgi:hypothetical protein
MVVAASEVLEAAACGRDRWLVDLGNQHLLVYRHDPLILYLYCYTVVKISITCVSTGRHAV